MNIKLFYDESGKDLQEIMEENLIDFYYEFYEQETMQFVEK